MNKITTFKEYRDACNKTMLPSCNNHDYLTMGLIEEIGELAKLVAKSIRGDYTFESVREKAQHECGDVAWFLMEIGELHGLDLPACDGDYSIAAFDVEAMSPTYDLTLCVAELAAMGSFFSLRSLRASKGEITDQARSILADDCNSTWQYLAVCCHACGSNLKTVLNMNNNKLALRKAKGCIMGNGDHREMDGPFCGCDPEEP